MRSTFFVKSLSKLYVQVLVAIVIGIALGHFMPDLGSQLKPLGDLFIKLIKMLLAPIIFASIVVGIARMNNVHEAGRVGLKAVLYFEIASTFALVIGLVVFAAFALGAKDLAFSTDYRIFFSSEDEGLAAGSTMTVRPPSWAT